MLDTFVRAPSDVDKEHLLESLANAYTQAPIGVDADIRKCIIHIATLLRLEVGDEFFLTKARDTPTLDIDTLLEGDQQVYDQLLWLAQKACQQVQATAKGFEHPVTLSRLEAAAEFMSDSQGPMPTLLGLFERTISKWIPPLVIKAFGEYWNALYDKQIGEREFALRMQSLKSAPLEILWDTYIGKPGYWLDHLVDMMDTEELHDLIQIERFVRLGKRTTSSLRSTKETLEEAVYALFKPEMVDVTEDASSLLEANFNHYFQNPDDDDELFDYFEQLFTPWAVQVEALRYIQGLRDSLPLPTAETLREALALARRKPVVDADTDRLILEEMDFYLRHGQRRAREEAERRARERERARRANATDAANTWFQRCKTGQDVADALNLLGLEPSLSADVQDFKRSWKSKMLMYHPDKCPPRSGGSARTPLTPEECQEMSRRVIAARDTVEAKCQLPS